MNKEYVKLYGSKEDLAELRKMLKKEGIEEHQENLIHAGEPISQLPPNIVIELIGAAVTIISTYLVQRSKRIVTRQNFGEKITIKGDFSAKEIERLLKVSHSYNIENNPESKAIVTTNEPPKQIPKPQKRLAIPEKNPKVRKVNPDAEIG